MDQIVNLEGWSFFGNRASECFRTETGLELCGDTAPFGIYAEGKDGIVGGVDWSRTPYAVIDIENLRELGDMIYTRFTEEDGRTAELNTALFAGVPARVLVQLNRLDGSLNFPPMTPGTLKTCFGGNPVNPSKIVRVEIGFKGSNCGIGYSDDRRMRIKSVRLSDEMPEFPKQQTPTADVFGQWNRVEFKGKIHSLEELREKLTAEEALAEEPIPGRDRFGGDLSMHWEGEGYFRVRKEHGRWYLVDPDGNAFFSSGVFGVYPGEYGWIRGVEESFEELPAKDGAFAEAYTEVWTQELYRRKFSGMYPDDTLLFAPAIANLIRVWGKDWYTHWACLTASRLKRWGINTLSMFSDPEFVRISQMPYVIMLKKFPETKTAVFREFPDVFSEEYRELSRVFASQLAPYADDPNMIGYFINNEPTWAFVSNLVLAEKLLETGKPTASLTALIAWLNERYGGDISILNRAWDLELSDFEELRKPLLRASERTSASGEDLRDFSEIMLRMYAGITAEECRKVDKNHLCLGMRFANLNHRDVIKASEYFDVFSYNCYKADPAEGLKRLAEYCDKPVMVGEFHFASLDAGLPSASLFRVKDQAARGEAYRRYMERAAAEPNGIGAHYFAWNDQPLWGRYDCENYPFGFVTIANLPYKEFTEAAALTNRGIYDVMNGRVPPLGGETVRM